jgi:hypothetical protein
VQYEGPWVDDIVIQKEVPGTVTVNGTLSYADRDGSTKLGGFTKVYLYENDPGGTDDLLGTTTTNESGYFAFPTRMNWDNDLDADSNNWRLDLYFVFEADFYDSGSSRHRVTNFGGQTYSWGFPVWSNIPDGTQAVANSIPANFSTVEAMWIFQDLRRAWKYVNSNTTPAIDPGSATAQWEDEIECHPTDTPPCGAFFSPTGLFVYIPQNERIPRIQSSMKSGTTTNITKHN